MARFACGGGRLARETVRGAMPGRESVMQKMQVGSLADLVRMAARLSLIC
jgi:FixJ family two-component response regulator